MDKFGLAPPGPMMAPGARVNVLVGSARPCRIDRADLAVCAHTRQLVEGVRDVDRAAEAAHHPGDGRQDGPVGDLARHRHDDGDGAGQADEHQHGRAPGALDDLPLGDAADLRQLDGDTGDTDSQQRGRRADGDETDEGELCGDAYGITP